MPWTAEDAPKHNKLTKDNKHLAEVWAAAANAALEQYGDDEDGVSKAMATANAAVNAEHKKQQEEGRSAPLERRGAGPPAPSIAGLDLVRRQDGSMMLANPSSFDPKTREADIIISNGGRVRRRDWDGEYDEVLDMRPGAIRLARLNQGAALLDSHNWSSGIDAMLGGIVPNSARVVNNELIARVKFSRGSEKALRVAQDLQDGIRFPASAGYVVHRFTEDRSTSPVTRLIADWEPMEVSLVTVPAEQTGTGIRASNHRPASAPAAHHGDRKMQRPIRLKSETDAAFKARVEEHFTKVEPIEGETAEQLAKRVADYLAIESQGAAEAEAEVRAEQEREERVRRAIERRARGEENSPNQLAGIFREMIAIGRQAGMDLKDIEAESIGPTGGLITVDQFRERAFAYLVKKQQTTAVRGAAQPGELPPGAVVASGNFYGAVRSGDDPSLARNDAMVEALTTKILSSRRQPAVLNAEQAEWVKAREITDHVAIAMRVADGKDQPKNPQARAFLGMTIMEMAAECIGYKFRGVVRQAQALDIIARAWHSTSDFPAILENALNKTLLARYAVAMPTYRMVAAERTFQDFRPHPQVRAGDFPQPKPVLETGELRYGTAGESKEVVSVAPYGIVFAISRQVMVNDDMGAIDQILGSTGDGILRFENTTFFTMMLANAQAGPVLLQDTKNVFMNGALGTGHNNYADTFAHGGGPPSITTLSDGRAKLGGMQSIDGQFLNVQASIILTGLANQTPAEQMVTQITPNQVGSVNPFTNRLAVGTEAQIPGLTWYMFASPQVLPCFVYGFLAGAGGPRVRTDEPFGVQGVRVSLEHDFGVGAIDYRGCYQNCGATS